MLMGALHVFWAVFHFLGSKDDWYVAVGRRGGEALGGSGNGGVAVGGRGGGFGSARYSWDRHRQTDRQIGRWIDIITDRHMYMYNCDFFLTFGHISSCSHCPKRRVGWAQFYRRAHVAGGLGAIRAVCRAWQAF